ncbi:helix-turn-helix domain-containing protein [Lentilactobacillus sp. SPB1-3]|uniref:Helix-turn-helix domain-containing protein n=1 Tax=Lentilactobacillus terminaliae TaxID=3003483 RepID=A0ACD5DHI8_9LACO|nr:helix-turn-helix transcriptional regulator [Lentilactobacillus sp. SPB1-3]MCZ0976415.1 helix-turn-helix transcriptional regulator [Lentilactobacillus sp. SPB1-3]
MKEARINNGLSQNDVATILHISRQAVSKWERGVVYPDLDNLIKLSDIYKISVDDLLRENNEGLKSRIEENNTEIKDSLEKSKRVNTQFYQNNIEGLMLIAISILSTLIPPLGLVIPAYVIWRNTKYNSLYKTIMFVSVIAILVSALSCYAIISDNWIHPANTTVYRIK